MNRASVLGTAALCLSVVGSTGMAHAAPCSSLPNPLVVSGSTAVQALVAQIAPVLGAASGSDQITIVYKGTGSCSGVAALAADTTPTGACTPAGCVTGTASYYTMASGSTPQSCDLDAAGTHIDLILSDVYKDSCEGVSNPNLRDQPLLVIPFAFITAAASAQEAIDAREAYYAYGRGMSAGITPWVNEAQLFRRNSGSGSQVTVFKNIHVPAGSTIGIDTNGNGPMITMVAGASSAEQALGFASLDAVDPKRNLVKTLALRYWGQSKFYWPDSSNSSFDKKNVRDGHYPLWGYEHAVTLVDGSGAPLKPLAKKVADILAGTVSVPGVDAMLIEAKGGVVPLCAMDVSRTADAGDFSLVTTGASCSCFFEKNAPNSTTSCKSCASDTDCTAGQHCRNTFCEAR